MRRARARTDARRRPPRGRRAVGRGGRLRVGDATSKYSQAPGLGARFCLDSLAKNGKATKGGGPQSQEKTAPDAQKMRAAAFVLAAAAALSGVGVARPWRPPRAAGPAPPRRRPSGSSRARARAMRTAMYSPQQSYGRSVAIDGDFAVVGAPGDSPWPKGAAYVLRTTDGGATYVELAKLMASDGTYDHRFGWSVAIDGTRSPRGPGHCVPGPRRISRARPTSPHDRRLGLAHGNQAGGRRRRRARRKSAARGGAGGAIVVGAWNQTEVRPTSTARPTAAARIPRWPSSPAAASACSTPQPCFYDNLRSPSVAISHIGDTIVAGAWGHDDAKYDAGAFSAS